MNLEDVFQSYKDCIVPSYTKVPLVFVKGKGSCLWDVHGKKYLDFFPGWGACNLGHCHPKVMCAVREQVSKLIFVPNNYYNLPQAQLARELNFWTKKQSGVIKNGKNLSYPLVQLFPMRKQLKPRVFY